MVLIACSMCRGVAGGPPTHSQYGETGHHAGLSSGLDVVPLLLRSPSRRWAGPE
jgi:hypothetical protein